MTVKTYKDLEVWKRGIDFNDRIYELTKNFPQKEQFVPTTQILRSAVSIPSNIAEGSARQHIKEYIQFCYVALGSCAELETQLHISFKQKYISKAVFNEVMDKADQIGRMLRGLIKGLKTRA